MREEHKAHLKWEEGNLYNSALQYFCNEVDLSMHIDAIQESKEKIEVKGIAKVFSCFKS